MPVIFSTFDEPLWLPVDGAGGLEMSLSDPCLIRSRGPSGEPVVRLSMPLVDDYLEFLEGRCRPNAGVGCRVRPTGVLRRGRLAPVEVRSADELGVHHCPAHRPQGQSDRAAGECWRGAQRGGDEHGGATVVDLSGFLPTRRRAATSPRTRCPGGPADTTGAVPAGTRGGAADPAYPAVAEGHWKLFSSRHQQGPAG